METIVTGDCLTVDMPDNINLLYCDPPYNTGNDFDAFDDNFGTVDRYVEYLLPRLRRGWEHLASGGHLIVHVDWRAVHYIKVAVDRFAGIDNFHNEIIWSYNSGGASKRHLSRKHDTLLWWATPGYTFNVRREPYATPNVADRPGFHPDGRMLTDVWQMSFISTTSRERTGYPTQKPVALLERIVEVFTNVGDLVADPFCGSGTTAAAAHNLGRRLWMCDLNAEATALTRQRITNRVDSGPGGA